MRVRRASGAGGVGTAVGWSLVGLAVSAVAAGAGRHAGPEDASDDQGGQNQDDDADPDEFHVILPRGFEPLMHYAGRGGAIQ
jgi:hypothetical protein